MRSLLLGLILTTQALAVNSSLQSSDAKQFLGAKAHRNYIKNSGAEKNADFGIYDPNNRVIRTTTNPLEGVASFEIAVPTSTADEFEWEAEPLQRGLWGKNCVASFTYSLNAAGYEVVVVDENTAPVSATVQLQNTESGSITPANKVELPFPCGASGGTYRIFMSATGTQSSLSFKADSFYLGEWDGVGSVAQAEVVLNANRITTNQSILTTDPTLVIFNSETIDPFSEYNTSTGVFTAKRSARLSVSARYELENLTADTGVNMLVYKNGSSVCGSFIVGIASSNVNSRINNCIVDVVTGDTIAIYSDSSSDNSYGIVASTIFSNFNIVKIPTTSEIVTQIGAPGSSWTAFTPTVTHGSGSATNVTHAGWYRCNGGDLELKYQSTFSNTSAAFSVWYYGLPTNFAALTTVNNDNLGFARFDDAGTAAFGGVVRIDTSTRLLVQYQATSTHTGTAPLLANQNISNTLPFTWTTSDSFTAYARVPVTASSPCAAASMPLIKQGVVYDTTVKAQGLNGVTTIENGTYAPTPVASTNTAAVGTAACNFKRQGNVASVSCRVPLTCTAASSTSTEFFVPLPVTSNLSADGDLNGVVGGNTSSGDVAGVCFEDTTGDRANCRFACGSTTSLLARRLFFQYVVK